MPELDLEKLWEEHTQYEFATRDTAATLDIMVEDDYVNHIPVLTGGYGKAALREFYSQRFIPTIPPDTTLTPISRTVGTDQLVDEMIFSSTHTQEMPWMLPGVAPTHKKVEIPRRQTSPRTHLLGSSLGPQTDWSDHRPKSSGTRRRNRP